MGVDTFEGVIALRNDSKDSSLPNDSLQLRRVTTNGLQEDFPECKNDSCVNASVVEIGPSQES